MNGRTRKKGEIRRKEEGKKGRREGGKKGGRDVQINFSLSLALLR